VKLAGFECLCKLRSIGLLARLDLDKLANDLPLAAIQIGFDLLLLRCKAET
jgi:hypothetical protein